MAPNNLLAIGKIVGVHGLRGNLKVYSYAESVETYRAASQLFIADSSGDRICFQIIEIKPHKRQLLLTVKGVNTREQAQAMTGRQIYIDPANLPELEPGVYYWTDLIGLAVFTITEVYLGRIESILQTGANDVYIVKNDRCHPIKETLIPALESVVRSIDLNQQTMRVALPEGL